MRKCCFWVAGLFWGTACFSQSLAVLSEDSLFNESMTSFRKIYFDEIKGNAQIYHGSKYAIQDKGVDGFPYFEANILRPGYISYQGTLYTNVHLEYDLTSDLVVVVNYLHDDMFSLASDKIDSFSIGSHVFIHFTNKSNGLPEKGFYEQLCTGDPGLYVRREKKFHFGIGNQVNRYVENNSYYIRVNNNFYKTDGKAGLLNIFSDQREAMKKYIRSNRLDFKKDLESALLLSTLYYSRLKH